MVQEDYLHAIKQGNREAFDLFYKAFWWDVYQYAKKLTFCDSDAEELVQDVFVDIWVKRERIEVNTTIKGYLLSAIKFKLIDKIRKERRFDKYAQTILHHQSEASLETPEAEIIAQEKRKEFQKHINQLPDRCREIYQLRKIENKSIAEIAQQLGLSEQTVKNQLNKAHKILTEAYQELLTTGCLIGYLMLFN
jgi:RNA polymerase sigma-70 factor (ECF subfamily)